MEVKQLESVWAFLTIAIFCRRWKTCLKIFKSRRWCTHYTKEMSVSSLIVFFPLTFNLIHTLLHSSCSMVRSDILNSHCRCSIKKGVLKYFTKFTGKHLKNTFFHRILPVAVSVYIWPTLNVSFQTSTKWINKDITGGVDRIKNIWKTKNEFERRVKKITFLTQVLD